MLEPKTISLLKAFDLSSYAALFYFEKKKVIIVYIGHHTSYLYIYISYSIIIDLTDGGKFCNLTCHISVQNFASIDYLV